MRLVKKSELAVQKLERIREKSKGVIGYHCVLKDDLTNLSSCYFPGAKCLLVDQDDDEGTFVFECCHVDTLPVKHFQVTSLVKKLNREPSRPSRPPFSPGKFTLVKKDQ
jgi:hypothetical protein